MFACRVGAALTPTLPAANATTSNKSTLPEAYNKTNMPLQAVSDSASSIPRQNVHGTTAGQTSHQSTAVRKKPSVLGTHMDICHDSAQCSSCTRRSTTRLVCLPSNLPCRSRVRHRRRKDPNTLGLTSSVFKLARSGVRALAAIIRDNSS